MEKWFEKQVESEDPMSVVALARHAQVGLNACVTAKELNDRRRRHPPAPPPPSPAEVHHRRCRLLIVAIEDIERWIRCVSPQQLIVHLAKNESHNGVQTRCHVKGSVRRISTWVQEFEKAGGA